MSNRSARFVSAIFASILAGTNFAAVAENAAKTTDNCLSGPKGAVPAGRHWYYRIDHATKRQCWYNREESDTTARATPLDITPSPPSPAASSSTVASPVPPPQNPAVRKSIADARAELTSPQMRIEQDSIEPRTGATAPDARAPSSPIASRWPDSLDVISQNNPRVAAAEPPANPPTDAIAAPQPAMAPVALAAADSSLEKQSASMQMLFLVMAGALALAGITASLIFRAGRARARKPEIRRDRRAIWDQVHTAHPSPSMFPDQDQDQDVPIWRANVARDVRRDPRAPDDPERRVTEMLARLARSAEA